MASDLPNVAIEPKELLFQGPNHREPIARHLALTNPHNRDVCFKVKTTAPKRYYVRPNAARLRANTSDTVEVVLQPQASALEEDDRRDKFLVQIAWLDDPAVDDVRDWVRSDRSSCCWC